MRGKRKRNEKIKKKKWKKKKEKRTNNKEYKEQIIKNIKKKKMKKKKEVVAIQQGPKKGNLSCNPLVHWGNHQLKFKITTRWVKHFGNVTKLLDFSC